MSLPDPTLEPGSWALVTGGAGFVGSHIVDRLLDRGVRVRVLDDFSTGREENLKSAAGDVEIIRGSVTDISTCMGACEGMTYVLHQAAVPSVQRSVEDPLATHHADATGTLNMLVAARDAGVRRFVYAGSSSAYGDSTSLPKHELMPSLPLSPYSVAKLTGENYARAFHRVYGLETVILRYFNVFGPRQDPAGPYSAVVPLFLLHAIAKRAPTIHGDGGQTRDFTFVDNVVDANLLACAVQGDGVAGELFNVGCGDRTSLTELWRAVQSIAGVELVARSAPGRAGDVRDSQADLTKIGRALGYEPNISLHEGLSRTLDWLRGSGLSLP